METPIIKAIRYIETHLNEELTLESIADVASYSPYHFSRIFKRATGENIGGMIKRLRLAQSTHRLLHTTSPITEIALDIGYETHSSFNKAFKKIFGISPSEYQRKRQEDLKKHRQNLFHTPELITFNAPLSTLSVRALGEYGEAALNAWGEIITQAHTQGTSIAGRRYFGLCFDNPSITEYQKMRYEACVHHTPQYPLIEGLETQYFPKGTYARVRHQGSYDDLYDVWLQFYGWINEQGYILADFPPLEEYLDNPEEISLRAPDENVTYLYLLLKELS